jgi:hypothetical protein
MRFRIVTIQLLILLAAAPLWTLCEGVKAGCPVRVALAWVVLVVAPMLLMGLVLRRVRNETVREWCLVLLAMIAIAGYYLAVPVSFAMMDRYSLRIH